MNQDFQLKLQAYLDGELPEREAREVETALNQNAEARALVAELRNTSGALTGFEAEIKVPESREFYWSKIQRDIERLEKPAAARPVPLPFWKRFLMPAGGFAALVLVTLIGVKQFGHGTSGSAGAVETILADSGAVTYRDNAEGMTVVWLSYPAENGIADIDPGDTID